MRIFIFATFLLFQVYGVSSSNETEILPTSATTRNQKMSVKVAHTNILSWNIIIDEWILTSCDYHSDFPNGSTEATHLKTATETALLVGFITK